MTSFWSRGLGTNSRKSSAQAIVGWRTAVKHAMSGPNATPTDVWVTAQAEQGELPIAVRESCSNLVILMLSATFPRSGPRPPSALMMRLWSSLRSAMAVPKGWGAPELAVWRRCRARRCTRGLRTHYLSAPQLCDFCGGPIFRSTVQSALDHLVGGAHRPADNWW